MSGDLNRQQVIELMGDGIPAVAVASLLGVEDSYVSQIANDPQVKQQITERRAKKAAGFVKHDSYLDELEHLALERVGRLLPMETSATKAAAIFARLNAARRRSDGAGAGGTATPGTVISIQLPPAARVALRLTADQQVIEVDSRSMVPLQASQVQSMLKQQQTQRLLAHSAASIVEDVSVVSESTKKSLADLL